MKMMRSTVQRLLIFGWSDRSISQYLLIKPNIVRYYRHKFGINRDQYQDYY